MKVGILSDTHGHLSRTEKALALLRNEGSDHLVHCGDLGGEEVVTLLFEQQEAGLPVTAVPGNVDEWNPGLILYAKKLGLPLSRVRRLRLEGISMAVFHGHDPREMARISSDPAVEVLFTGHTHVAKDDKTGPVRIINPGAVYRASVPGVAVFDTKTRACRFLALEAGV